MLTPTHNNSPDRFAIALLCVVGFVAVAGCMNDSSSNHKKPTNAKTKAQPRAIPSDAIDNLYRVTPDLFSGGQPHGEAAFAQLQQMGVKTIISVDGVTPDVATASRFGIRYVHLPVQYVRIEKGTDLLIAKAVLHHEGATFIHCHHGKHRGPTAAAVAAMVTADWSNEQAEQWMKQAGTSPHYEGLYQTVADFTKPSPTVLESVPDQFPQTATLEPFTASMARIGEHHSHLKLLAGNDFAPLEKHPDLSAKHEALLLHEQFRESRRSYLTKYLFFDEMDAASNLARQLLQDLQQYDTTRDRHHLQAAHRTLTQLNASCKQCHKWNRD